MYSLSRAWLSLRNIKVVGVRECIRKAGGNIYCRFCYCAYCHWCDSAIDKSFFLRRKKNKPNQPIQLNSGFDQSNWLDYRWIIASWIFERAYTFCGVRTISWVIDTWRFEWARYTAFVCRNLGGVSVHFAWNAYGRGSTLTATSERCAHANWTSSAFCPSTRAVLWDFNVEQSIRVAGSYERHSTEIVAGTGANSGYIIRIHFRWRAHHSSEFREYTHCVAQHSNSTIGWHKGQRDISSYSRRWQARNNTISLRPPHMKNCAFYTHEHYRNPRE